jgi:2-polyprenyl-3-methyl-5-hydroxy-6-metoxy-1,4-benzoquinol methylase
MDASQQAGDRIACPICARSDTQPVYAGASGPIEHYPLVRCNNCTLVFQQNVRSLDALDEAQSNAYGEPEKRFGALVELGVRTFRLARVRLAQRLVPPGSRVLDVGCGRGLFLRLLSERGYSVRGTELSAATAANAYPGVQVDAGELDEDRYPDHSFELVSIWHVLEHLREPQVALRASHRALVPNGLLVLAVPNFGSVQSHWGGAQWFHLDLPRHIFHFTPQTLKTLVEAAGFELVQCRTGQWEMDPFGLAQTALNRVGFRHNALYDSLRNSDAARADLSLPYRLGMLALFPLALALALPCSLLFRALGRAGTIIAIARKPASSGAARVDA